jgi:rhodanese-related sulfurtransferase
MATNTHKRRAAARIVLEAVMVGVTGFALAFLANQISPRGLNLATIPPPPSSSSTPLAARLETNGIHLLERPEVEKLFRDPRVQQFAILFIDARDEEHYQAGHIPGAFEFDPYHREKYLADILTPCQFADQIIVYCTGGDCGDSESAALILRDAGVPASKLFIYGGGMSGWEAAKLPLETGPRNSGNIRNPAP